VHPGSYWPKTLRRVPSWDPPSPSTWRSWSTGVWVVYRYPAA